MELKESKELPFARDKVWTALNDPAVLQLCIPGCESMRQTGENQFELALIAKVGPVKARFTGSINLEDLNPPESYYLVGSGKGGVAGFARGGARVTLEEKTVEGYLVTTMHYVVDAAVGGKLAQIGSRLVDVAARKLARDFFERFTQQLSEAG
ncbi:MAG: carbon monoxide dehydrogenase subunit G [bacterium]|nr:carbon monoxide dehydrogenase [Gammaproteobacteria bacterium]